MILVLGGTTEGRLAVKVLDESGKPYFYSTRGEWQQVCCRHGQRVTGGMDAEKMEDFCRSQAYACWLMRPILCRPVARDRGAGKPEASPGCGPL